MAQAQKPLDSKTCPLCGNANDCRVESGACWCATARFAPGALARVPEESRDKVCICQTCATQAVAES